MSHEKPAILGEPLYHNPLLGADGGVESAFGHVLARQEAGEPYGEIRVRDQIWGENIIPSEPAEIADEIILVGEMITTSLPRSTQRLTRYFGKLITGYSDTGGSASLMYFGHTISKALEGADDRPAANQRRLESLKTLNVASALHAPMEPEERTGLIESDILPPLVNSFEAVYDLVGMASYFTKSLPAEVINRDEIMKVRISEVLQACSEQVAEFSMEELAEWFTLRGTGLPNYNQDYYEQTGIKIKTKYVKMQDLSVLRAAGLPLYTYFYGPSPEQDNAYDFDKLRSFIDLCKEKAIADSPSDRQASPYWSTAQGLAYLICGANTGDLSRRRLKLIDVIESRSRRMIAAGLAPEVDAMVSAYLFCASNPIPES